MRFQYLNEDKLVVNIRTQKIGYITGTMVTVDVQKRLIKMEVDDNEDQQRQQNWHPQKPQFEVGYGWMFSKHIEQAPEGCDFNFFKTDYGEPVNEPDIF